MNKVVLIGRLTKDPDLRFTAGKGTAVATTTIAVDRRIKTPGQPEADFIPLVAWGKLAENISTYSKKGKMIGIAGRIQTRSYEAQDGSRRYVTEAIVEEIQFIEWARSNTAASTEAQAYNINNYDEDIRPVDDGEIPF